MLDFYKIMSVMRRVESDRQELGINKRKYVQNIQELDVSS